MTGGNGAGPARAAVATAEEYARALALHRDHDGYRCDDPRRRLMGRGCRTCGVETVIAIADFQATGDLEAYESVTKAKGGGEGKR